MKKTYIAPLTEVVKINAEQMICDSPALSNNVYQAGGKVLDKEDADYDEDLW